MKSIGVYKNLEKELKIANITRKELEKLLPFNINSVTRKLANKSKISLDDAIIIRNLLEEKTGDYFDLEYLFEK